MEYKMAPAQMETATPERPTLVYAGFWKRFVAAIIDGILIGVVNMIVSAIFIGGSAATLSRQANGQPDPAAAAAIFGGVMLLYFITLAFAWLYFAFMESSANQATLGKMALGLRVTDMNGNRISFGRATGRYFGRIVSSIILMIGYIMAAFTEKKQALHDMMAGTLVLGKSSNVPANVAANAYKSETLAA
jgi:uncharacterized RDD family membrane protein YckC